MLEPLIAGVIHHLAVGVRVIRRQ